MSTTQIHLALNHIPVLLSITGALLLLYALLRKNGSITQTGLSLLVAAGLFTLPVYLTGEGTEESVEHLPGVGGQLIDAHEDMALVALTLISLTGLIALASFIVRKNQVIARRMAVITLFAAFVSFGTLARTAQLGGEIRHSELRGAMAGNPANEQPASNSDVEHDD